MNNFINVSPKVDGESVRIAVDGVIKIINAVGENRFGDEVAIKALEAIATSIKASADYLTISGCSMQSGVNDDRCGISMDTIKES